MKSINYIFFILLLASSKLSAQCAGFFIEAGPPEVYTCNGGSIIAGPSSSILPGVAPHHIIWTSDLSSISDTNALNPIISGVGCSILTVIDSNGCVSVDTICIIPNASPIYSYNAYCDSLSGQLAIEATPDSPGSNPPYTYEWMPSTDLSHPDSSWTLYTGSLDTLLFVVVVTDSIGCVDFDSVYVINNVCDSLTIGYEEMISSRLSFQVYPNPVTDKINLQLSNGINNQELEIHDIMGRIVLRRFINKSEEIIDVSNLETGSYIVRVLFEAGVQSKKIQIIK